MCLLNDSHLLLSLFKILLIILQNNIELHTHYKINVIFYFTEGLGDTLNIYNIILVQYKIKQHHIDFNALFVHYFLFKIVKIY